MARPSPARRLVGAVVRRAVKATVGGSGGPPDQRDNPDTKGARGLVMRAAAKVAGVVYPTNASGNSMSVR